MAYVTPEHAVVGEQMSDEYTGERHPGTGTAERRETPVSGPGIEPIRADETANGPFDIIFFGNECADSGGFQVGIRAAYALGRPCVTGLKKVTLEGLAVRCEREVEGGRDVYVVPLPAVLTVKEGLNLPRYPSVPGKMRARTKPRAVSTPSRPGPRLELINLAIPAGQGRRAESLGNGAAAATAVVDLLQKTGVL